MKSSWDGTDKGLGYWLMDLFNGVGLDLGLEKEDPSDPAFIDFAGDRMADLGVSSSMNDAAKEWLQRGAHGKFQFKENKSMNLDRLIDSLLEDKKFNPNLKDKIVKFEFTSSAMDDLEDPHVAGTAKLTGNILDGQFEAEVIKSDNPQIEKDLVLYLEKEDIKLDKGASDEE